VEGAIKGTHPKDVFPTAMQFSVAVERHSIDNQCSILDSLKMLTEEHRLDAIDIPKLLTTALKQKLGVEQGIYKEEIPLQL
jgi:hypothetical protein